MSFNTYKKDYYASRHLSILRESPEDMFLNGERSEDIYVNFEDHLFQKMNESMKPLSGVRPNKPPPPLPPEMSSFVQSNVVHPPPPPPPPPIRGVSSITATAASITMVTASTQTNNSSSGSSNSSSMGSNVPDILAFTVPLEAPVAHENDSSGLGYAGYPLPPEDEGGDPEERSLDQLLVKYVALMHDAVSWQLAGATAVAPTTTNTRPAVDPGVAVTSNNDIDRFERRRTAEKELYQMLGEVVDASVRNYYLQVFDCVQQLRNYCETLRVISQYYTFAELNNYLDYDPLEAAGNLMKMSFNESYRRIICNLGGLEALAQLIVINQAVLGDMAGNYHVTVRRYTCMALTNLTFGISENKSFLCSVALVLSTLIHFLCSCSEEVKQVAASVIRNLSWKADTQIKQQLRATKIARIITKEAIKCSKESCLKSMLSALWNISSHSTENKVDICEVPGSIAYLVDVLSFKAIHLVESAGGIIRNVASVIATNQLYRSQLRERHGYRVLLKQLRSPSLTVVGNACGILSQLVSGSAATDAGAAEDHRLLWQLGAVGVLRSLVQSRHNAIATGAASTLQSLLDNRVSLNIADSVLSAALTTSTISTSSNSSTSSTSSSSTTSSNNSGAGDVGGVFSARKLAALEADISSVLCLGDNGRIPAVAASATNNSGSGSSQDSLLSNGGGGGGTQSLDHYQQSARDRLLSPPPSKMGLHQQEGTLQVAMPHMKTGVTHYDCSTGVETVYPYEYDSDTSEKPLDYSRQFGDTDEYPAAMISQAPIPASVVMPQPASTLLPSSVSSSGVGLKGEQPRVYATEDTPIQGSSSRVSPLCSLDVDGPGTPPTAAAAATVSNVASKKSVKFNEQTPLMFSRNSSVGSLDSFETHSLHSSIASEYSRLPSELVSPSELPDSPGDTEEIAAAATVVTTSSGVSKQCSPAYSSSQSTEDERAGGLVVTTTAAAATAGNPRSSLIQQCIQSGMKKSGKLQYHSSSATKMDLLDTDNAVISYADEGTPFAYSTKASSLSDISIPLEPDTAGATTSVTMPISSIRKSSGAGGSSGSDSEEQSELLSEIIQSAMPKEPLPVPLVAAHHKQQQQQQQIPATFLPGVMAGRLPQFYYCELDSPRQYGVEGTPNSASQRDSLCSESGGGVIRVATDIYASPRAPGPPPRPPKRTTSALSASATANMVVDTAAITSGPPTTQQTAAATSEEVACVYMTENTPAEYSRASPSLAPSELPQEIASVATEAAADKEPGSSGGSNQAHSRLSLDTDTGDKSSLSSLSIESAGMERTLLQQCITSAMPTPRLRAPAVYSRSRTDSAPRSQNRADSTAPATVDSPTLQRSRLPAPSRLPTRPCHSASDTAASSRRHSPQLHTPSLSQSGVPTATPSKSRSSNSLRSVLANKNPCFSRHKKTTNTSASAVLTTTNSSSSSSSSSSKSKNCSFLVNGFDVKPNGLAASKTNQPGSTIGGGDASPVANKLAPPSVAEGSRRSSVDEHTYTIRSSCGGGCQDDSPSSISCGGGGDGGAGGGSSSTGTLELAAEIRTVRPGRRLSDMLAFESSSAANFLVISDGDDCSGSLEIDAANCRRDDSDDEDKAEGEVNHDTDNDVADDELNSQLSGPVCEPYRPPPDSGGVLITSGVQAVLACLSLDDGPTSDVVTKSNATQSSEHKLVSPMDIDPARSDSGGRTSSSGSPSGISKPRGGPKIVKPSSRATPCQSGPSEPLVGVRGGRKSLTGRKATTTRTTSQLQRPQTVTATKKTAAVNSASSTTVGSVIKPVAANNNMHIVPPSSRSRLPVTGRSGSSSSGGKENKDSKLITRPATASATTTAVSCDANANKTRRRPATTTAKVVSKTTTTGTVDSQTSRNSEQDDPAAGGLWLIRNELCPDTVCIK